MTITIRETWQARLLVVFQFGLLGAWVLHGPVPARGVLGVALQLAGVSLAAWSFAEMLRAQRRMFSISPDPAAHRTLVCSGPYRWIRHPMYVAILLAAAPSLAGWPGIVGLVLMAALAIVLVLKLTLEERLLERRFPDYPAYRRSTWRLCPFVY